MGVVFELRPEREQESKRAQRTEAAEATSPVTPGRGEAWSEGRPASRVERRGAVSSEAASERLGAKMP